MEKVKVTVESSDGIRTHAYSRDDGENRKSKVALWNHPGDDVTGMLARMERVAGTMQEV